MIRRAVLSPDGVYRYELIRCWRWDVDSTSITWVMLNPSTADADVDDPTIRRCIGFSKAWGFDEMAVVNLFALRSTNPKALRSHPDPIGPENERYITERFAASNLTVAAWGAGATGLPCLDVAAIAFEAAVPLRCLGTTKAGHPRHPLYVKADTELEWWNPA